LLVLVWLSWTASNYAQLLGDRLKDDFIDEVDRPAGVVVSSEQPLFLDGPEVDEDPLPGSDSDGSLHTATRPSACSNTQAADAFSCPTVGRPPTAWCLSSMPTTTQFASTSCATAANRQPPR
jgi:hypothetical protein